MDSWYGYENPTFIKDGKILASIICHENSLYLQDYIADKLEISGDVIPNIL